MASPSDVVEVAGMISTRIAFLGDAVVNASELECVVSSATPCNIDKTLVFLSEPFGACFSDTVVDLP